MSITSFYALEELQELGFQQLGQDVHISRKCSIYGADRMCIGNHVRIDDFCLLSGNIIMGSYIHVAAYSALYGGEYGIELKDFVTISSRCVLYAESDDYSGNSLSCPLIGKPFRQTYGQKLILGKHVLIGSGSTILPGASIEQGVAIGAMSLVKKPLAEWKIYAGVPAREISERSKKLLGLETKYKENEE